jgi:hypothetical protein
MYSLIAILITITTTAVISENEDESDKVQVFLFSGFDLIKNISTELQISNFYQNK